MISNRSSCFSASAAASRFSSGSGVSGLASATHTGWSDPNASRSGRVAYQFARDYAGRHGG